MSSPAESSKYARALVVERDLMRPSNAAKNALECVLEAVPGESALIVCDAEKGEVGEAFADGALSLGLWTRLVLLETTSKPRTEVPQRLLEILSRQRPDVYVNVLRGPAEETPFRIKLIQLETRGGVSRLGHCPGVTLDMLTNGALALTAEEHRDMQGFADKLIRQLEGTIRIDITTPAGTELSLSTRGREFFTDTKIDWRIMRWLNFPTGEVMVAPVEDSLEGKLLCDTAVGGVGRLRAPLEIIVRRGKVVSVSSDDKNTLRRVKNSLRTDAWSSVVGEFAFGINAKARFVGEFLEAEKIHGTVHVAFGNNRDMPRGRNPSRSHMDFLVAEPSVKITKADGTTLTILENRRFKLDKR